MHRDVSALSSGPFDLLVVGGGIYGAWAACDAARRGLTVALIERTDWGAGTSSASSKLIHGGLRYLEHGWFRLVRKTLVERDLLVRLGPHRIRPLRVVLPVDRRGRRGPFQLRVGLTMYDWLAPRASAWAAHRKLDQHELATRCGFLSTQDLNGAFEYGDAVTDDARFVLEVVDGSIRAGAVAANHVEAVALLRSAGGVEGVVAEDRLTGRRFDVRARLTLAAAGPWLSGPPFRTDAEPDPIRRAKGVHLMLPALPTDRAVLLTARSDGRPIFLIPWLGRTLVGTTDTPFKGPAGSERVEDRDVDYLLTESRRALVDQPWSASDIVGSFVGVRAMVASRAANPAAVPREWKLGEPARGLMLSLGGKLTSARVDATRAVDAVVHRLGRGLASSTTSSQPFPWAPDGIFDDWLDGAVSRGEQLGLDPEAARSIALRHGRNVDRLHTLLAAEPALAARIAAPCPLVMAEVVHAARDEMAGTVDDIVRRRVPVAILASTDSAALAGATRLAERELLT
ncbi:MAG: glycerol-3-phosphate dehydrogenase/oxidase [Acidobacteria bacterium]|nr:glycerol-3-phosphate dehydrogenase/oxidase [Acidobacteriota bacterium]